MPPTASLRSGSAPQASAAPVQPVIPFTAAAHRHIEPITVDSPAILGAAQQQRGPFDIPAYGFIRHVILEVSFSGGTLGAGVLSPDWPWNVLQNVTLSDVNGAPIFGPLDGYALLQANIAGGYAYRQDPRLDPNYDGTINGRFFLRIPVEISKHNAYGALANQNAAAAYKLSYTINTAANAFSTAPTTAPTPVVRCHLEAWSQPNAYDLAMRPQAVEPVAHGTTQFWSAFTKGVNAGQNNVQFPRVGNLIRNLVVICRNAAGARVDTVMPDPLNLFWDARSLTQETQQLRIKLGMEAIQAPGIRDTGVFLFLFDDLTIGHAGDEEPNLWLPTVQASRLELNGVSAVAGTLQVMTNDIAPVAVDPSQRYVETSQTGFHPAMGQPTPQGA
jgi:hypothetical protein